MQIGLNVYVLPKYMIDFPFEISVSYTLSLHKPNDLKKVREVAPYLLLVGKGIIT